MSNILKVTTPVSGYDNIAGKQNLSPSENMNIKNPVDPGKIVRADQKPQTGQEQGVRQGLAYESNFGNFVQTLRNVPKLREVMSRLLFNGMANLIESGISKGTAEEIHALFQALEMSPDKLQEFLKSQSEGANRLQGPLFTVLRGIMDEAPTVELKTGILDFLKKYNDLSSEKHIFNTIKGYLKEMEGYMFRKDREVLHQLSGKLLEHSIENNGRNTQILKQEIIPFLGTYISETKNMGKIRDLINLLTFNTARYENGNLENITQSFRKLLNYPSFQRQFGSMKPEEFADMLRTVDFDKAAGKAEWSEHLLNILESGVKGEAGLENKDAFLNIVNSILINESVYMPVLHLMLPVILDGVPMFSELWIDPNEKSGNENSEEKGIKLLIKFDMKDVGFFDIMMYYEKGKMDMLIHYPDTLAENETEIRNGLREIMKKNHLEVEYLAVEQGKEPISVSAAFPKIFERRNSLNVTI